ncbi:MAG TPA: hypothetical protein VEW69_04380 [Alphaproteobacteria bacterium]|nr:hypothetical protein [Alphaproteobacteria bacterium]
MSLIRFAQVFSRNFLFYSKPELAIFQFSLSSQLCHPAHAHNASRVNADPGKQMTFQSRWLVFNSCVKNGVEKIKVAPSTPQKRSVLALCTETSANIKGLLNFVILAQTRKICAEKHVLNL